MQEYVVEGLKYLVISGLVLGGFQAGVYWNTRDTLRLKLTTPAKQRAQRETWSTPRKVVDYVLAGIGRELALRQYEKLSSPSG